MRPRRAQQPGQRAAAAPGDNQRWHLNASGSAGEEAPRAARREGPGPLPSPSPAPAARRPAPPRRLYRLWRSVPNLRSPCPRYLHFSSAQTHENRPGQRRPGEEGTEIREARPSGLGLLRDSRRLWERRSCQAAARGTRTPASAALRDHPRRSAQAPGGASPAPRSPPRRREVVLAQSSAPRAQGALARGGRPGARGCLRGLRGKLRRTRGWDPAREDLAEAPGPPCGHKGRESRAPDRITISARPDGAILSGRAAQSGIF